VSQAKCCADKYRFGAHLFILWNRGNTSGIVIGLIAGRPENWGSILGRSRHCILLADLRPVRGPTQPYDQSVAEAVSARREVSHSTFSSVEVMPASSICLQAWS
jgi:hypothetical protein